MKTSTFLAENEQSICNTCQSPDDQNLRYDTKDKITKNQEFSEVQDVSAEIHNFSTHYDLSDSLTPIKQEVSVQNQEGHLNEAKIPIFSRSRTQNFVKKRFCFKKIDRGATA
jgi:hypothetical protein